MSAVEFREVDGLREVELREGFYRARARWGRFDAYEQAWLFLLQAMRRGGWIVDDNTGWVAVAKGYVASDEHAMVCCMSEDPQPFVERVLRAAERGLTGRIALIKHIEPSAATALLDSGFTICNEANPDTELGDVSEDRFPQVVIDIEAVTYEAEGSCQLLLPATSAYSDFRYQVRRCLRRFEACKSEWDACDISGVDRARLTSLVHRWAGVAGRRFESRGWPQIKSTTDTLVVPNLAVVDGVVALADRGCGQIVLVDGVAQAAWIGERNDRGGMGIYLLIADTRVFNLAYLNLALALQGARQEGARVLLLGGSEVESLFRFKLVPSSSMGHLYHLRRVVDYERCTD